MTPQETKQAADRILHHHAMSEDDFFDGVQGVAQAYLDAMRLLGAIVGDAEAINLAICQVDRDLIREARDFLNGDGGEGVKGVPKYVARLVYKNRRLHQDREALDLNIRRWLEHNGVPEHKVWLVQEAMDADDQPERILAAMEGYVNAHDEALRSGLHSPAQIES